MPFAHRDSYFTITPLTGPNAGKPYRLLAAPKVSFDPGGKAAYLKGFEEVPIAIVQQTAEPKLDVDCDSAPEAWAISDHVGGIGGEACTIAHVFRRPGQRTMAFRFLKCQLENGGGYDSDDNGVKSKLAFKLRDCHVNGKTIYSRRSP